MKTIVLTTVIVLLSLGTLAQVSINTDGADPDGTAILDLKSTNKGFLSPRMTNSQRDAISVPVEGLIIYNTDVHKWQGFDGTNWVSLMVHPKCRMPPEQLPVIRQL